MVVGTAIGLSDWGTVGLAVALAFLFGYTLTSLPLLRAGLAFGAVVPIALASDTLSIAVMEIVDNAIILAIPGALDAGVGDVLFWGTPLGGARDRRPLRVPGQPLADRPRQGPHRGPRDTGIHGGPPTRVVAIIAAIAFVFGSVVLLAEAF